MSIGSGNEPKQLGLFSCPAAAPGGREWSAPSRAANGISAGCSTGKRQPAGMRFLIQRAGYTWPCVQW